MARTAESHSLRPLLLLWALVAVAALLTALGELAAPAQAPPSPPPEPLPDAAPVSGDVPERELLAMHQQEAAAALPVAAPADLAHEHPFTLQLRLVDAFNLPVPDAVAFVAPLACGFVRWPVESNGRGSIRIQFRGRRDRAQLIVAVIAYGVLQPVRAVHLEAGREAPLTIVVSGRRQDDEALRHVRERTERTVAADARRVQQIRRGQLRTHDDLDVLCGRTQLLFRMFDCTNCHDQSQVRSYELLAGAAKAEPGLHPFALFQDLGASRHERSDAREAANAVRGTRSRERRTGDSRAKAGEHGAGERGDDGTLPPGHGAVVGTVRNPDQTPAVFVPVAWLSPEGELLRRTTTDTVGRYRLAPVTPGSVRLVAGGGGGGDAETLLRVEPHDQNHWDCMLLRHSIVTGTVVDETGAGLGNWRVEFESANGEHADLAPTEADGSFTIPSAPGPGRCLCWPPAEHARLPVVVSGLLLPDAAPEVLALHPEAPTRARLRLFPVLPPGTAARAAVRVHQLESGRVAWLHPLGLDGAFEIDLLPAGFYHLEIGGPDVGWLDRGILHVDGRGLWNLGRVPMPAPGRVVLCTHPGTPSPLDGEHALYRRSEAFDVLVPARRDASGALVAAPGEHVLLWREQGALRAVTFHVAAGATHEVRIE